MLSTAQPKPEPRVRDKRERCREKLLTLQAVHRHVDRRDGLKCRVCKRRADPRATSMLERGERHHVILRSACGKDTPENILLLCLACHCDRHAGRLHISGNAEKAIHVELVLNKPKGNAE